MNSKQTRKRRVRAKIQGTTTRPRLSVSVSLNHINAQIIDDTTGKTLASASDLKITDKNTKTQRASLVGTEIATKAKKINITKVVYDRGPKLYHGRVRALAEAARSGGLKF